MSRDIERIEVVEDRTATSTCDVGFLRLRRYVLKNVYSDGSTSRPYDCDVVSRRDVDAVAVVLFERGGPDRVRVALRTGVRPPVWMRGDGEHRLLTEVVAGVLEAEDAGVGGVESRASAECLEEAGYDIDPAAILPLGGGSFPTPGVTDEHVLFRAAETDLDTRGEPTGDGSVMEECGEIVILPMREAIRRCRNGEFPDMKTEIGLLRLCDAVGYLPSLDRFLAELPASVRDAARDLPPLLQDPLP